MIESVLRSLHDPAAPGHAGPCPTCEDIVMMVLTIEAEASAAARAAARADTERLAEALEDMLAPLGHWEHKQPQGARWECLQCGRITRGRRAAARAALAAHGEVTP